MYSRVVSVWTSSIAFCTRATALILLLNWLAPVAHAQSLGSPCGDCSGKVTQLTLQYNGTTAKQIEIEQKDGTIVYSHAVQPGQQFTFNGTDSGTFGTEISILVNGVIEHEIHTSCSKPIGPGLTRGEFTVIDGYSKDGGRLCKVADCLECDGGITHLTLRYNGSNPAQVQVRQKNGDTVVNQTVQPGQDFSFIGTDSDNKLGSEITLLVNGSEHTRIHTSCSKPIGPGLVAGDFTVVQGTSRDGGKLCDVPDCLECDGGVTHLTLRYNGTNPAQVQVRQKNGDTVVNQTVQPGQDFSFIGTDSDNKLGSEITLLVNGSEHTRIHTSCSKPIGPGLVAGDFEVVQGISKDGGKLCPPPDCGECKGGVVKLTLRFDGPNAAQVRIVANNGDTVFNNTVQPNERFTFIGTESYDKLGSEIKIYVNNGTATALHTSCSQPIGRGVVAGTFTVIEAYSKYNGKVCEIAPVNETPIAQPDTASVSEDDSVTINVLDNDSDPDGDPLTIISVTQGNNGSANINTNGTVSYSPNPDFNGSDSFSYTISDGRGGIDSASVTVTVTPVNDPPNLNPDVAVVPEDSSIIINVLDNDTDIDGDPLTVIGVTPGGNGSVSINPNGTIQYTPNPNFNGSDTFTYTVDDGNGGISTIGVSITVNPVNDDPVANPDSTAGDEDSDIIVNVLDNDTDIDGDPLTVISVTQGTHGSVSINPNGSVTYSPNPNFNGDDSFSYTVDDGNGGTSTATVSITVNPVNDDPIANPDSTAGDEDSDIIVNVLDNDTDVDGDTLSVISVTQGTHGSVSINPNGTVTYSPNPDFNGNDSFSYTVDDGNGGTSTATVSITVNPVNDDPIANPDIATVPEDSFVDIDVLSNDTDVDGDSLAVVTVTQGSNGSVSINPDGTVRYTPNPDFNGPDSFTYTIDDGNGGTASIGVSVTVGPINDDPIAEPDVITSPEGSPININVLINDSDPEGDSLTVVSVTQASHGTVGINPDGTVRYIPDPDYVGSDSFTYTINDGNGGTATATVAITLTPVNDPPVARDDFAIAPEDSVISVDVLVNDSDVDGDSLSVASFSQGSHGTVSLNPDGTVRYVPELNYVGSDAYTYVISDGNGETASATVRITLTPVNDAPTAEDDSASTPEDTAVNIDVLANDSDVDGDTISVATISQGNNGIVSINPDGTVRYTPNKDFTGSDFFSYSIHDGNGETASAKVSVNVTAQNDPPVANDDSVTAPEDTQLDINVLANDSDVDGDTISVISVTQGNSGTVSINPDGTVHYSPNADFVGTDSFSYTIDDGNGATDSATVTVTFTAVNDDPVANDDSVTAPEDTKLDIDVLANDSDVDGDTISVISVTQGNNGSVSINPDGTVHYSPNADFVGTDSFSYTIDDGNGATDSATVTVTFTALNDDPVANDDSVTAPEDTELDIDVLANDSDVDGDTITVVSVTQGNNGSVSINPDGTVHFSPNANFVGTDSFSYTIDDGNGATDSATVTVTFTAVNDDPVANDDSVTAPEDTELDIDVLANDSDVDGDTISVISVTQGNDGTVSINPDGTVHYSPNADFVGTDSFSYTIDDGNGATDSATVTVTFTALNDDPVANDDSASTMEDTGVDIDVLVNDTDVDGDTISVSSVTQGNNGTVSINPDGTVHYQPSANFNGSDNFSYAIRDGNGGTASATVTILISEVNDPPVAVPDLASTDQNVAVDINVLANDMDPDNDTLTVMSVTQGSHGSVTILPDGRVRYLPEQNYHGGDSFTYVVVDGNGGSASTTVTLTVILVNLPPVANPDTVQGLENTAICISSANLLANDVDPNGDPLTVTSVDTNSANGGVLMLTGDIVTYTPSAFFTGSDTFTYVVTDDQGASASATVTVLVDPPHIQLLDSLHLNRQTGIFEQTVRVTNPVTTTNCGTMTAVRVLIDGLPSNATVHNASGHTNELWFVQYDQPLEPGESVDLVVEYYLVNRVELPTPAYSTHVVLPAAQLAAEGTQFQVDRTIKLADGNILLEFKAIPGRTYAIQYTSDLSNWKTARPYLVATAEVQHWIDSGAPKTESKPAGATMRCYRLILLPTP